jgi:GTP-binding protein
LEVFVREPVITIVGRPNVGKSTLFNRLIGRRQAIVDNVPGITRDRNYGTAEWTGHRFLVVDTGGYLPDSKEIMDQAVKEQVEIALSESDIILFLLDVRTGITVTDEEIARLLVGGTKPVFVVVNKVDDERDMPDVSQFFKLGLGDPYPVSAMIGLGTGDLLDAVVSRIRKVSLDGRAGAGIKLAVIGKENVGKSSLVNTLLNETRQIVTDIPGTTRDSIDSELKYKQQTIILIDTAGLKKKARIKENILFYSNLRTYKSIRRADVVLYMIDTVDGLTRQDIQVMMQVVEARKGLICVFNKWDLVEKDHRTMEALKKDVKERLGDLRFVPIIFTSVLNRQRLYKSLDLVMKVYEERKRRIQTADLNTYFETILKTTTPPAARGREIRINYVTQIKSEPPLFAFYSNYPELIADHYKRFLENKLREKFSFEGVPISISFRKK